MAGKKQPYKKCGKNSCYNNAKNRKFCSTCRSRKCRKKDPIKYAFNNLKASAKKRNKFFYLTLDDFKEFCYEFQYMETKGRGGTGMTVDCIIDELGYTKGNLQALNGAENSAKWHVTKKVWYGEAGFTTVKNKIQHSDGPF